MLLPKLVHVLPTWHCNSVHCTLQAALSGFKTLVCPFLRINIPALISRMVLPKPQALTKFIKKSATIPYELAKKGSEEETFEPAAPPPSGKDEL